MTAPTARARCRLAFAAALAAILAALVACAPGQHRGSIGITWDIYDSDADPGPLLLEPTPAPAAQPDEETNGQN